MRSLNVEIDLYQRANIRIGEIASSAVYRMNEFKFVELNYGFLNWKYSMNLSIFLIVKFWKFVNLPILKISDIYLFSDIENFKDFPNSTILRTVKFSLLTNHKIIKFLKFVSFEN